MSTHELSEKIKELKELKIMDEELKEEITNFKRQNPKSYIVVILHWGVEYQPLPTLVQRKGAHSLMLRSSSPGTLEVLC